MDTPVARGRFVKSISRADRIALLPGGFGDRFGFAASLLASTAGFGAPVRGVSLNMAGTLRVTVTRALFGGDRARRSPDVAFVVLCKGHLVDPLQWAPCRVLEGFVDGMERSAGLAPVQAIWDFHKGSWALLRNLLICGASLADAP